MFNLKKYYLKYFPSVLMLVLSNIFLFGSEIINFYLSYQLFNNFITPPLINPTTKLIIYSIGLVASYILSALSLVLNNYFTYRLTAYIEADCKKKIYEKFKNSTNISRNKVMNTETLNIMSNDINSYLMSSISFTISIWISIVMFVGILLAYLFLGNLYLFIFLAAFSILEVLVNIFCSYLNNKITIQQTKVDDKFHSKFSKWIKTFSLFLFSNKLYFFLTKTNDIFKENSKLKNKLENKSAIASILEISMLVLKFAIFITIALYLYKANLINLALILAIGTQLNVTSAQTKIIISDISNAMLYRELKHKLIDTFTPLKNKNSLTISNFKKLEIVNGDINYDTKNILHNINFSIKRGDKILLKGKSGSGKSSLLNVLFNNLSLTSGNYNVNNNNIDIGTNLQRIFTYCNDENIIFDGNLYDNLTFFEDNPNIEKLNKVISDLNIDFINDLTQNLCDMKLSEGQKQLINLARVLYSNNDIVIIDEGFSNLDKQNFDNAVKLILNLNKTLIIISHQLDKTYEQKFTKVLELKDKQLQEFGLSIS